MQTLEAFKISSEHKNLWPTKQNKLIQWQNLMTQIFVKTELTLTDVDFCHQGWDTNIAQKALGLSKHTDMTIHWKGIEQHFLMVPLVFRFIFRGKLHFLTFSQKTLVLS
jgi:hypothetical protein